MSLYGPGQAVTSALGQALSELAGVLFTRLAVDLPPAGHEAPPAAALLAHVETTLGMEATGGTIAIEGEIIEYGAAAVGQLSALERDPFVTKTYRRGTLVAYLDTWSDLDLARDSMMLDTAEGAFLTVLGQNYGVPRYLDVPDAVYRVLIRVLAYMPGKGTRSSIDAFLEALLGDQGLEGTCITKQTPPRLEAALGTFQPGMARLLVDVVTPTRTRRARITHVSANGVHAYLDRWGSPHWEAADLDDENDCTFHVMPFEVVEPLHLPCTVWVRIRTAPPDNPLGFAYLQGGEVVTPANVNLVVVARPIRQALGVWLATDTGRQGTNFATSNTFVGSTIMLDTPLPGGLPDVVVDYGWAYPGGISVAGIPGAAIGRATAEILPDVSVVNPDPILVDGVQIGTLIRYPLYLGGRLSALKGFLDTITVGGVIPELDEVGTWE